MMTLIIPRKEAPVSGEGTVVIPQPAGDEPVIKNTFFFPDIDPKRVRERMRLEQTVAPARLREAIKSGMAETNAELYEYREQKIAAGFTRLADVPADDIDGESIKVFYYERAVCAMATASLYERYRGVDASAKGDKKADSIDSTIDELWRDMRWAVARIQDKPPSDGTGYQFKYKRQHFCRCGMLSRRRPDGLSLHPGGHYCRRGLFPGLGHSFN